MDVTCVSGGVRGGSLFVHWWWTERFFFFFLPLSGQSSLPSALRGSGLEKEVKLKGGASRLGGERAPGTEGGTESTEVSLRSAEGETGSAEVAPIGCTGDGCVCYREEQAERKAEKGLHDVCLPSAG